MPTAELRALIAAFKKKNGRNPSPAERAQLQQQAYKKAANERARKKRMGFDSY
tara:strand:- start:487 stop:645 length:159 start_codon:yes stop_codon:yes gene_type:complete